MKLSWETNHSHDLISEYKIEWRDLKEGSHLLEFFIEELEPD